MTEPLTLGGIIQGSAKADAKTGKVTFAIKISNTTLVDQWEQKLRTAIPLRFEFDHAQKALLVTCAGPDAIEAAFQATRDGVSAISGQMTENARKLAEQRSAEEEQRRDALGKKNALEAEANAILEKLK